MQKGESTNRTGYPPPPSAAIPPRSNPLNSNLTSRRPHFASSIHPIREQQHARSNGTPAASSNPFKQKSKANFPSFESAFQVDNKKSSSLLFINESFEEDSFLENMSHSMLDLSSDEKWTHQAERESVSPLTEEDHEHSLLDQTTDSFFNSVERVQCLVTPEKMKLVSRSRPVTRGTTSMNSSYLDTSTLSSKSHNTSSNSLRRQSIESTAEDLDEDGDMIQLFNRVLGVQQQQCQKESSMGHNEEDEDEPSFLKDSSSPWLDKRWRAVPNKDAHSPFDGTFCLEESILILNHESPDKILNTTFKDQSILEDGWTAHCHDKSIELMQDSSPTEKNNSYGLDMSHLTGGADDEDEPVNSNIHPSPTTIGFQSQPSSSYKAAPLHTLPSTAHTHPSYLLKDLRNKYLNSELLRLSKDLFVKTKTTLGGTEEQDRLKEALRRPFSELASKYLNSSKNESFSMDMEQVPMDSLGTSMSSLHDKENDCSRQSLSHSFSSHYEYKFVDPEDSPEEKSDRFSVNKMLCHWRT